MPIKFVDLLADDGIPGLDPEFGLTGVRLDPGAVEALVAAGDDLLVIVFGGELTVEFDGKTEALRPGMFAVVGAGSDASLRAGSDGATYLTSWPLQVQP